MERAFLDAAFSFRVGRFGSYSISGPFWGVFKTIYKFEPLGSSSEVYGLVGSEQALASSTERSSKYVGSLPSL